MNLITDKWIPVLRQDGPDKIAPCQIVEPENRVIEINAPRPDFQGALYQFLIGLLQTAFAPEDEEEWQEYWEEIPDPEKLKKALDDEKILKAFELYNPDGPAFMQDYNLPELAKTKISSLLIDAPGGKTLKDNLDHFVKRDQISGLCESCAAIALFALQINAPSGGVGHRVGLRGGGPLTTLVVPSKTDACLWHKIWLNVLNKEEFPGSGTIDASVMPWLGPTRTSETNGVATTPNDVHALQMYWGMPRRIRLEPNAASGTCDVCGSHAKSLYKSYKTKNYGTNYGGAWVHPLTPYRFDENHENPPISMKGQQGGLGYRYWLSLAFQDSETGFKAATVVGFFNNERGPGFLGSQAASLWCFGYDMDNMKARCWYDTRFPLFLLDDNQRENLVFWAGELIGTAREVVKILRSALKSAWFKRPGDVKGDMSNIDRQFWETTEPKFFELLDNMAKLPGEIRMAPPEIYLTWFKTLEKAMFELFEKATLYNNPEDYNLKRIIQAKEYLSKKFYKNKAIKDIKVKTNQEVAANE